MGDISRYHGDRLRSEIVQDRLAYFRRVGDTPLYTDRGRCLRRLGRGIRFDEVHFGGFAAKYIRQRFFMDVHPPLAKLLITLAAFIGGFDGEFDFKDIGK